jgi:hypothetical protein
MKKFFGIKNLSLLKKFQLPVLLADQIILIFKNLGSDQTSLIIGNSVTAALAYKS